MVERKYDFDDYDPHHAMRQAQELRQRRPPGSMGGMSGMDATGGMDDPSLQRPMKFIKFAVSAMEYSVYVATALAMLWVLYRLALQVPAAARFLRGAMRRKRTRFEKAAAAALCSVALPVMVAQIGLIAGPVLPPTLGFKIYVYGSFISGAIATLLGAGALVQGEASARTRAMLSMTAGMVVLGLWFATTQVTLDGQGHGSPTLTDVTTDVDDPPSFNLLADANHTAGYPPKLVGIMREFYDHLLEPQVGRSPHRPPRLRRAAQCCLLTPQFLVALCGAGDDPPDRRRLH